MLATLARSASTALASVVLAAQLCAQSSRAYENQDFGYRIKPPKEWTQIPMQSTEKWQTAKWLSDRAYFFTESGGGWTYEHKPELVVIAFPTSEARNKAEVHKKDDKDKGNSVLIIQNPYKDYLDYLKATNNDGGYYVSAEKEIDLGDHTATCYEIKIEKLTRSGPKRIVTWVHKTPLIEFAVQIDVLENSWDKLKKEILDTQKSFGLIASNGSGLGAVESGERIALEDEDKLTAEQRKARRVDSELIAHRKAKDTLTDGWQAIPVGRFLILSHTDEKFARRVGEQAEAVFKWCEATFPFVGSEEYVRQPVIRLCASSDELSSFYGGGGWFFFGDRLPEIVAYNDQAGFATSYQVDHINSAVFALWFQDRDRDLWWAMPGWLGNGLRQLVQKSRVDKGKLTFRDDIFGRDQLRELIRDGKGTKPRELFKLTDEDYVGTGGDQWASRHYQSGALVRFLTTGAGAKSSKTKGVLRDYVKALSLVVEEIEAKRESEGVQVEAKPKTEEEEEAYFRNKNQEWKKREQELLDQAFERCFFSWDDADWAAFEKAYFDNV